MTLLGRERMKDDCDTTNWEKGTGTGTRVKGCGTVNKGKGAGKRDWGNKKGSRDNGKYHKNGKYHTLPPPQQSLTSWVVTRQIKQMAGTYNIIPKESHPQGCLVLPPW